MRSFGSVDTSRTFYYKPADPASIVKVNLHTDIGSIDITYNDTPTPYYMKVQVKAHAKGPFARGKSFDDYFKPIIWKNESASETRFVLEARDRSDLNLFSWFSERNITVTVTLRTDVVYDVIASTQVGKVDFTVSNGVTTRKISLNATTGTIALHAKPGTTFQGEVTIKTTTGSGTLLADGAHFVQDVRGFGTTGDVTLTLTNCTLGGDVGGVVSTGTIETTLSNLTYTQTSNWAFSATTGSVELVIQQFTPMRANVTGSVTVSVGSIDITYRDGMDLVGAKFVGTTNLGDIDYSNAGGVSQAGNEFSSIDFGTAPHHYDLDLSSTTGDINVDAASNV